MEQECEQVASCSPVSYDSAVEEYENYNGDAFVDPRESDLQTVSEGLIEIVKVEGPMLAKRAYDIYLRHCGIKRMGKDLKKHMNQALQHAIDKKLVLHRDEWDSSGLIYSIVRLPEQDASRLRTLGDRTIDEIPPSEIQEASIHVLSKNNTLPEGDEHLRLILNLYGLKRLTIHTQDKLFQALASNKR